MKKQFKRFILPVVTLLLQEVQDLREQSEQRSEEIMALADKIADLRSDIAKFKQDLADKQAAEDAREEGQKTTLAQLAARVTSLESGNDTRFADLEKQIELVVDTVDELVEQAVIVPPPPPPEPTPEEPIL